LQGSHIRLAAATVKTRRQRGPRVRIAAILLVSLALVAGCLSSTGTEDDDGLTPPAIADEVVDGAIDPVAVADNIGTPIEMEHDHNDALLHTGHHNLDLVGYSALGVTLGENGFANFVLHDEPDGKTTAFIASDGDDRAGLVIADVTDPSHMVPLGSLWIDGNNLQEVRVTPDGLYAVINVQVLTPDPGYFVSPDGAADCGVCILVVDVHDRAHPSVVSALPVELFGTHNMEFHTIGGQLYLFYVGQPLSVANPDVPGNRVGIARFVTGVSTGTDTLATAALVPVGTFTHPTTTDDGRSFPHDVTVAEHPVTGQTLAYVSHWDGGALIFDVSTPELAASATEIARNADASPSSALAIHWMVQEPAKRADGRVIAWSAPEIGSLDDGTGVIRAYDVTDPTRLEQLGTWTLPGNATISGAGGHYILSPHVAMPDQETGLLAVAHYHAGVWVLDMSDPAEPRALGYYLPHGNDTSPYTGEIWWKKPNFDPTGYLPNAYMVRWHDGLLWASERGTGLYALRYTGPVPGSVL
jgi:hypothetical protein